MKADNVMVDWSADEDGQPRVERVALADLGFSNSLVGLGWEMSCGVARKRKRVRELAKPRTCFLMDSL